MRRDGGGRRNREAEGGWGRKREEECGEVGYDAEVRSMNDFIRWGRTDEILVLPETGALLDYHCRALGLGVTVEVA